MPAQDWLAASAMQQEPVQVGRFFIHGPKDRDRLPAGALPIEVEAGLAFGLGEHATTQACLEAIDRIARVHRFRRVLDLGCGSGILAMGAARCWPARLVAADYDPVAVRVARENFALNGLAGRITTVVSDGTRHSLIRRRAPYDLVLANILADPLIELAPALTRRVARGWLRRALGSARPAGRIGRPGLRCSRSPAHDHDRSNPLDGPRLPPSATQRAGRHRINPETYPFLNFLAPCLLSTGSGQGLGVARWLLRAGVVHAHRSASTSCCCLPCSWRRRQRWPGRTRSAVVAYPRDIAKSDEAGRSVAQLLDRARKRGKLRLIVGLDAAVADESGLAPSAVQAQRRRVAAAQDGLLRRNVGTRFSAKLESLPFVVLDADQPALQRLLTDPGVLSVQEDVAAPLLLRESVPLIGGDVVAKQGFGGAGQTVAVLDTGVDGNHPMLRGKVVAEACYSTRTIGYTSRGKS